MILGRSSPVRKRPPRQGELAWYHTVVPILLAAAAAIAGYKLLWNFNDAGW